MIAMNTIVKAFAKINLFLEIRGINDIGYHLLDSVMQSVSLCDEIELEQTESGKIEIFCDVEGVPCDETNIAHKAARLFYEKTGEKNSGLSITLKKNIPHQAGLGGGSADGAGVLVALNAIYGNKLSENELCEIGVKVGADVPFCIVGGTKRAQGIGEMFTPLSPMPDCSIVIAKPDFGVSTVKAYADYDLLSNPQRLDISGVITSLKNDNLTDLASSLHNAFEQVVPNEELNSIKAIMSSCGALGSLMSGSGSAIFALFNDNSKAQACVATLQKANIRAHLCSPSKVGCQIL